MDQSQAQERRHAAGNEHQIKISPPPAYRADKVPQRRPHRSVTFNPDVHYTSNFKQATLEDVSQHPEDKQNKCAIPGTRSSGFGVLPSSHDAASHPKSQVYGGGNLTDKVGPKRTRGSLPVSCVLAPDDLQGCTHNPSTLREIHPVAQAKQDATNIGSPCRRARAGSLLSALVVMGQNVDANTRKTDTRVTTKHSESGTNTCKQVPSCTSPLPSRTTANVMEQKQIVPFRTRTQGFTNSLNWYLVSSTAGSNIPSCAAQKLNELHK